MEQGKESIGLAADIGTYQKEGKIGSFLLERGFSVHEILNADEMEKKYLALPDGTSAGKVTAMFNLVGARVTAE
jgi:hypothetical protein